MPTERSDAHPTEDSGIGISSKGKSRFPQFGKMRSKSKENDTEKKKQIQDYIAWVNNYLRKRPTAKLITDLRSGMQDGITLINLVEIAANSEIPFVERNPLSASARRNNLEKAIAFLNSDGANLSSDSTKDIIDGNMKGVMRVILAIAEKYNPRSVRPITGPPNIPSRISHPSTSSSSSSSVPSQDSFRRSHSPDRSRPIDQQHSPRASSPLANYMQQGNSLSQGFTLSQGYGPTQGYVVPHGVSLSQGTGVGYSLSQPNPQPDGIYSTPIDSLPHHVTQKITSQMPSHRVLGQKSSRPTSNKLLNVPGLPKPVALPPSVPKVDVDNKENTKPEEPETNSVDINNELGGVIGQLSEFKAELLHLHSVLLENINGDARDETDQNDINVKLPLELANLQVIEKTKEIDELQEKIKKVEEQSKKFEGECETLRGMVMERNQFITSMKSEIYRKEYRNDTERVDLQTQLLHKEKAVKVLEAEVSLLKASVEGKEREVVDMREKVRQHESMEVELREELDHVTLELSRVTGSEESLQVKLTSRDKKISMLEEKLEEGKRFDSSIISEDVDNIRKKLELFKGILDQSDQQTLLDGLEKSISDMLTKITSDQGSLSPARKAKRHTYAHDERKEEKRRRHKDRTVKEDVYHTVANPVEWTKVFYYMTGDKTETPYVTSVPRKSHEVRLKDFKAVFDRQGSYRYYFKSEDPDCGIVREEITSEDQLLPSWNGKIMVWVSEKAHHR